MQQSPCPPEPQPRTVSAGRIGFALGAGLYVIALLTALLVVELTDIIPVRPNSPDEHLLDAVDWAMVVGWWTLITPGRLVLMPFGVHGPGLFYGIVVHLLSAVLWGMIGRMFACALIAGSRPIRWPAAKRRRTEKAGA